MTDFETLAGSLAALRGDLLAIECLVNALVERLPPESRVVVHALHETEIAAYRAALESASAAAATIDAFDRHIVRSRALLAVEVDQLSFGAEATN